MIAHRPWLGVSTRDWFINSDTPQFVGNRTRKTQTLAAAP
jgi:hypothetical protein